MCGLRKIDFSIFDHIKILIQNERPDILKLQRNEKYRLECLISN